METLFLILTYPGSGGDQRPLIIWGVIGAVFICACIVSFIAWHYLKSKFAKEKGGEK